MKKTILSFRVIEELTKSELKEINGGAPPCRLLQTCGISKEYCIEDLFGRFNESTQCCSYLPRHCN